jgi:hypothetical protein
MGMSANVLKTEIFRVSTSIVGFRKIGGQAAGWARVPISREARLECQDAESAEWQT